MKHSGIVILLIGIVCVSTGIAVAIQSISKTIQCAGTLKAIGIEVFLDASCTQIIADINWGALEAGSTVQKTVYVKNTGNAPVTLHLTTDNWIPVEAATYISLTWDGEGKVLNIDEVAMAALTLSVSATISGITSFSFDIVMEGTG